MSIVLGYLLSTSPMTRLELAVWMICGVTLLAAILYLSRRLK